MKTSIPDRWTVFLLQQKLRRNEPLTMPEQRWLAFAVANRLFEELDTCDSR